MVGDVVEDEVVPLLAPGEVVAGIVDDMVRADRPEQCEVPRAGDGGDLCASAFAIWTAKVPISPAAPLINTW